MNVRPLERLGIVAAALRRAGLQPVFVGGATIPLHLDAFGAAQARDTLDVDCIVDLPRRADYDAALDALRQVGFVDPIEEGAPVCRMLLRVDRTAIPVDIMPIESSVLGFSNRFYRGALETAEPHLKNADVLVATPGYSFATKIAAWQDRGVRDAWLSTDLEDSVALLDGCASLRASLLELPAAHGRDVAMELRVMLSRGDIEDLVEGKLPRPATDERIARCMGLLSRLTAELAAAGAGRG